MRCAGMQKKGVAKLPNAFEANMLMKLKLSLNAYATTEEKVLPTSHGSLRHRLPFRGMGFEPWTERSSRFRLPSSLLH